MNSEEWGSIWLIEYERIAWSYCESAYGDKHCQGVICRFNDSLPANLDEPQHNLEVLAKIRMPCGSEKLIKDMAKFCRASICGMSSVSLSDQQNERLGDNAFCLQSLLSSAFPKNPRTTKFKGNIGPHAVLDLNDLSDFTRPYCAFCGLGVLLLSGTRRALSPISTDEKIMELSDGLILSIIDGGLH